MTSDPVGTIRRHPDGDRFAIRTYAVFADAPPGYTTWTHVSIAGVASTPHTPVGDYYDSWPVIYRPPHDQRKESDMSDINYNPPRKITRESLHRSFNGLVDSVERQHDTFDTFGAQDLLRPVAAAIREAQRLVDIQIEKSELAAQEQRAANIQSAIEDRKKRIAELESA